MTTIYPRVNFFDGMQITEADMDVEQAAWHDGSAQVFDLEMGSGVEKNTATQLVLFDLDNVPSSVQSLLDTQSFDGEPIYPADTFGNTVYTQPSDPSEGIQLEVEVSDATLLGSASMKVYIFGTSFGNQFTQEVLTFSDNGSKVTYTHFTKIVAIMTQDFRGNQNNLIDGHSSRNVGGRLRILEALPMALAIDAIMVSQTIEPNIDYVNFKPATLSKTLDVLLGEIAASAQLDVNQLGIQTTATTVRELPPNNTGLIIGEKFQATTNNIQKVSVLLSVKENVLAVPGHEFDWSGSLVVGIRALQTTMTCPTDTIPGEAIDFDPQPSSLAEVSFTQTDLENLGVSLNGSPQIVDFIFTQSLLANPNISNSIQPGQFYVVTIRRSGDVSNGTIQLQEAINVPGIDLNSMRLTIFSNNQWTDVPESNTWFVIYTDALRITDGTAFDGGVQITIPKTSTNLTTGTEQPYIEGHHSYIDVSFNTKNFAIVQRANNFSDPQPHPATGNPVDTRIEDVPNISIVSQSTLSTLLDAGNKTVILGYAIDTNPVNNPEITGTTANVGLLTSNTFTILNPDSDLLVNNLIGSVLIPNVIKSSNRYRIVKVEVFTDLYGDINGDGIIDLNDVVQAEALDGYAIDLVGGTIPSVDQQSAIESGIITMAELLRADVNSDGLITTTDAELIQQHIALGTAFDAGASFKRVVLTVESLTDPLNTSPDMIGDEPEFNSVPFSNIDYSIQFIPLWTPDNLVITDLRRFVPRVFTEISSVDLPDSGGSNTSYIPGDLLLQGNLLDVNGNPYAIDFEINTIVFDLPEGSTQGELDVFNNFIKNQLKFADGTFVLSGALAKNQVRVSTAIQSYVKDIDGYDLGSIDGNNPIDETIAVLYTQSSGILRIRAANIRYITTRPELRTKIALTVYLKKAGFKNTEVLVSPTQIGNILTPI